MSRRVCIIIGKRGTDLYIYAHILDRQCAEAKRLLNKVLPDLKDDDSLYSPSSK